MTSIFIGGSRKIARLNDAIRQRLDNIMAKEYQVLIGDANGADRAVQEYLSECRYGRVRVFCMDGASRNNIGHWQERAVHSDSKTKDFRYFATKDLEMAQEADYGFMLWDGISKGSLNNIFNLIKQGKPTLVYYSPTRTLNELIVMSDLSAMVLKNDPGRLAQTQSAIEELNRIRSAQLSLHLK